ncbi:hypothetical protein D5041_08015 [Verminephrobacter aporrectodeae subsp. tuberculatae]|uniref:DUF5682 family protein n=1 Tax=Verminephrobacter aporrectodeae TaxID=1110389 RepID=UPI002238BF87|nr:DUF5682 family protein [Verminephrobacter aporrectodeae]MCW5223541.1 hypothetical protein [Verminephrobacter aporrectodeae subsp. tuberculatae]MCW5289007.1 hypothetical protein [Verminephrobacter aporrectodeae subsp. tuberculatae]
MTGPASPFHIFGIRHHGPGCARTLVRTLDALAPDCILVEGPPEANDMLGYIAHAQMEPPVALLVHARDDTANSLFYPLAEFSPEWQALRWALAHAVPARFMDLPAANILALRPEAAAQIEPAADAQPDPDQALPEPCAPAADASNADADADINTDATDQQPWSNDPLDCLAQAAGHADGEAWWNHLVEERGEGQDLFLAIAEAMRALREQLPDGLHRSADDTRHETLREAHMRQTMRQALKDGFGRIAVVCGAWHLPALETHPPAKADAALLKGLPATKTSATWVPWTYPHLSRTSGYGAGVHAPGWYEHLWSHDPALSPRSVAWLAHVAALLRSKDIDCSSAHIIEAARLADTLGTLRGRRAPGLEEINEAIVSVICMGNTAPMQLIGTQLIVGERIGRVPDTVPMVPLQQDCEQSQKRLRLRPQALAKIHELDLRNETDLARSQLLHRLRILGVDWGTPKGAGSTRGTFKEVWELEWAPGFSVALIEASRWGANLEAAASAKLVDACRSTEELTELAQAIDKVLLADLKSAVGPVTSALENRASLTGDVGQLLAAIAPLANIHRYGSVRKLDTAVVARVLDGIIVRAGVGLLAACSGIAQDLAQALREHILAAHAAIGMRQDAQLWADWSRALGHVAHAETADTLLRGMSCRLLFDAQVFDGAQVAQQLTRNLSPANDPLQASNWLDGFLNRNALVLLHDTALWSLVDDWVATLAPEPFISILPLVRRTFSAFDKTARSSLGQLAAREASAPALPRARLCWNEERAAQALPVLAKIFGITA